MTGVLPATCFAADNETAAKQTAPVTENAEAASDAASDAAQTEQEKLPYEVDVDENGKLTFSFGDWKWSAEDAGQDRTDGTVSDAVNSYLNLRSGSGMEYEIIGHLLPGEEVQVVSKDGDWYQVVVPERTGYVYKDYVDISLTTIRKLKEHNVEVYFEKENIWTFDSKGELLLTIMSSLAQEESRSISENCTWGQRKRFADGKVTVPFKRFLGYDMGPDHNLVVNPEQAKLVKRIYGMFLQGQSPFQIARTLTEEGIPSPGGKDHWNPSNIKSILTNEKYKGDALLQKSFTVDFLTKKKKTNEGEIPQYYVKDNHEAIIDPETFEMVQTLMTTRTKGRNRKSSVSIFSSKVKCGDCGSWYGPKVWHSNDAYRKVIWQCNHKFDGQKCATPTLTEDEIKELFLRATNQVIDQKEQFIAIYEQVLSRNLDTTALESELSDLEAEINIAAELIEECIKENAHVALDQDEYQKRYDALVARFDKAKARHTEVTDLIAERMARKHQIEAYLKNLRSREPLTEFRGTDWLAMVDYIIVHNKKDIRVTFKDGTEIET